MKIAFAGNKTTTFECMNKFLDDNLGKIDYLIHVNHEISRKNKISGYMDLNDFCKRNNIKVISPSKYDLRSESDIEKINKLEIDIIFVIGWQRLIPKSILASLSIGAFGMHGSPEPLPRGRGRSPLNWSLINDKKYFITNLFKYDEGVDSGEIVDSQKFEINHWDDCETLHFKNRISMNMLIANNFKKIIDDNIILATQDKNIKPTYFPKRTAEDGKIIWEDMDMRRIHNHIRAQTKPFPGAFSFLKNQKIYIWKAHPFDGMINYPDYPGTVVEKFYDGTFLVNLWDGTIRVVDFSMVIDSINVGDRFMNE